MTTDEMLEELREIAADTLEELEEEDEDSMTTEQRRLQDLAQRFIDLDESLVAGDPLPKSWQKKK